MLTLEAREKINAIIQQHGAIEFRILESLAFMQPDINLVVFFTDTNAESQNLHKLTDAIKQLLTGKNVNIYTPSQLYNSLDLLPSFKISGSTSFFSATNDNNANQGEVKQQGNNEQLVNHVMHILQDYALIEQQTILAKVANRLNL